MRGARGARGLIRRKLGRCIACLRLAVTGALAGWLAAAALFVWTSTAFVWIVVAIACAFTVLAIAHLTVAATRVGPVGAMRMLLAVYKKLGCGCDDVPVGFAISDWYDTQEECEDAIDDTYAEAAGQADGFCNKSYYECIDKDCPWLHWVNNTSTDRCECTQGADGRWHAVCDLVYKTQCCCSPEL